MSDATPDAKEIFLEALDRGSPEDLLRHLDEACGENTELRSRVEELLRAHREVGDFLGGPPSAAPTIERPITEAPGTVIGPYKLLQKIGEGGFGVVYMADQAEPVKRRVALKIIKPGMDTRQVIARFEAERQALAMMDHPNIARVLDAGTTESGRPYFVMDLVKGVPITQFCDEKHLTPRERLELFVPVCQAIQHAHQKGIIHRDIKPSNVLVAKYDDRAVPKVIDFGVAKATEQRLTEETMFTQLGQVVGTVDYMSPEQAKPNQLDIDTRSDVYSLGVVLYELLTGETPFDRQRLRSAALDELVRIIREEEPPKPSLRVSTSVSRVSIAANRRIEPKKLSTLVRGELDWIVMKALEKDRALRYQTAHGLALDIRRYLDDGHVQARPPSRVYRLRKFVRRNKLALVASACVALAVLAAVSFGLVAHWRRLRETEAVVALQRAKIDKLVADSRAEVAETDKLEAEVNALVEEAQRLSSGVFPDFPRAVELLSEAIRHRPEEARLYLYRGSARYESGRSQEAIADLERSLELSSGASAAAHWLIAKAAQELGEEEKARRHWELASQRDPDSLESMVVEALATPYDQRSFELLTEAIRREPFAPLLYYYRGRVGYNLVVRNTPKRLYDTAIDDLEKALRGRPRDMRIVETLCRCLVKFHFLADARQQPLVRAKQLLDTWLAAEPDSPSALAALVDWYLVEGRPHDVIEACLRGKEFAPRRPEFPSFMGWASRKMERHEDAIEYLSQALNLDPERAGVEGRFGYVAGYAGRAKSHFAIGREDLALQDLAEAARCSPPRKWTFYDWYHLISAHRELGKHEEGLKWCEKYVQLAPECSRAYFWRGTLHVDLGDRETGAADFVEALSLNPASQWAYIALLGMYLKDGEYEAALEYCDDWISAAPHSNDPYRWRGLFFFKSGRHEEALRDLGEALRRDGGDSRAYYERGNTYVALRQYDNALADFDKASELDPEDADVPLARAYVYREQKQYERAAADFSRALEHRPDDVILYHRRAEAYRHLKRYDAALADLDRVLELNPQDSTAHDRRGLVYAVQSRHEEAVREYVRALALNPREPWTHVHLVNACLALGNYQEALRCCSEWISAEPTSSEPYRLRGTVHSKSGAQQAALDAFGEALRRNPKDRAAYVERGRVYAALGQPAKALADYDKALELDPKHGGVYYSRGCANAKLRRYQQALADFNRALEYNESKSWLYYHRADVYWRLGRYREATADCREALQLGLNDVTFRMMQARIFTSQNRLAEALDTYMRAYELDPRTAYVRDEIVNAQCKLGDHSAALAFCDHWIGEEPESSAPYRFRGFAHYCSGAFEKAVDDYELALERDPNDHAALYGRGQARLAMNHLDQGHADIARSVELCPKSAAAVHLSIVGGLYGDLEQWDRAEAAFGEAVELDALSVGSWHLLALTQLAQTDREGYHETCARMLRQFGRTEDPNYAELVARTGILQEGTGNGAQLLALANQAVEGRPEDARCRTTLGAVLYRTGQMDEALTHLEAAARLAQQSDSAPPLDARPLGCFLAMAHHRQGNHEEAARWLSRASVATDKPPVELWPLPGGLPDWSWRLVGDVLRREAKSVLATVAKDVPSSLTAREHSPNAQSPD